MKQCGLSTLGNYRRVTLAWVSTNNEREEKPEWSEKVQLLGRDICDIVKQQVKPSSKDERTDLRI